MVVLKVESVNGESVTTPTGLDEELTELKDQIQEIKKTSEKAQEEKEEGFMCLNKALEIPLVSGLTSSVYATTEYISSTRPASLVSESIKTVGEREDVKNVLTSVTTLYENNMGDRVEELRKSLNPTLKNLDGYACTGIDLVNEKVSETKETYVDPMVNKINETKEAYVVPVVEKVNNMKEQTTKVVSGYAESAANMKTAYVDPAIEKATVVKSTYVDPAINKAYTAVEDPKKAYGEAVTYGKDIINNTKDVTITSAINTMDSAKEYLLKAKDVSVDQMQMYVNEARESVRIASRQSLERAVNYSKQIRDDYARRTAELMLAAQAAAYEKLHARYPTIADLIDRGINRLTTTTQILFQATKTTVTVTIDSTRKVADKVGDGVTWTKESYSATKEAIVENTGKVAEYGSEFTKANEDNIRYLANIAGLSSYIGFIGLELEEKKL